MASTKKPDGSGWPAAAEHVYIAVAASLNAQRGANPPSMVVAYSGGKDSHLLLIAAQRWCAEFGGYTRAVYIDHGLQAQSTAWGLHCAGICRSLDIDYQCVPVVVDQDNSKSPEQAARDARYQALESQLQPGEWLLTAHHADDQAETLLLQLLRGAGLPGLASMPVCKPFASGVLIRPMLSVEINDINTAATALQLQWVEDASNNDTRYDRNYLRHQLMPVLKQRWPSAVRSLGRSASHAAAGAELSAELAAIDVPLDSHVLDVSVLLELSDKRRENALRVWIHERGYAAPSTRKLKHLTTDLVLAESGTDGQLLFDRAEVRRHGQRLYIGDAGGFDVCGPFDHIWVNRREPLYIPEISQTICRDDVPVSWIPDELPLTIKSRQGGEKLQLNGQPYRQSVKSLLQQQGLPPWERSRLPFVWRDDELLGIVGVGFVAAPSL